MEKKTIETRMYSFSHSH